jgi:hypothetical protein
MGTLGVLPLETFDKILLSVETVADLGNFVRTCRFVNERFKELDKGRVISAVLENELGPVIVDAKCLAMCPYNWTRNSSLVNAEGEYYDKVAEYHEMLRLDAVAGSQGGTPSAAELTRLCRTLHKINFLADMFVETQLRAFRASSERGVPLDQRLAAAAPLSRTERLRVVRALYRRQILSNTFAPIASNSRPDWWPADGTAAFSNTSSHQGNRLGLFAAYEPWELEQIDEVNLFLARLCAGLTRRSNKRHERTIVRMEIGEYGMVFTNLDCMTSYLREHTRLPVLHPDFATPDIRLSPVDAVLRVQSLPETWEKSKRDVQASLEGENYDYFYDYVLLFQLSPLTRKWQRTRQQRYPDPARAHKTNSYPAYRVPFAGDDLEQVPFAWMDALDGAYFDSFGEALEPPRPVRNPMPRNVFFWRCASFCLWDQRRVVALKGLGQF